MKGRTLIPYLLMIVYIVGSFITATISSNYQRIGHIVMTSVLVLTGVSLIVLNVIPYHQIVEVDETKRIRAFVYGVVVMLMGMFLLASELPLLDTGCLALGCGTPVRPRLI